MKKKKISRYIKPQDVYLITCFVLILVVLAIVNYYYPPGIDSEDSIYGEFSSVTELVEFDSRDFPFAIENDTIQYRDGWYRDCFFNISGSIQTLDNISLDVFDNINLVLDTNSGEFSTQVINAENKIFFDSGDVVRKPVAVWLEHKLSGEQLSPAAPINIVDCRTLISFNFVQVSNFLD